ncbi:MAG: histidine phosphatase family protein [Nitrososphaerales archaeon]
MNGKKLITDKKQTLGKDCFFVVRHGETQANVLGINAGSLSYSLTKKGKREIEFLAKMLSKTKISGIYCSPILRTIETARILAHPHGLGVQTLEGLTDVKLKPEFVGKKGRQRILTAPKKYAETYQELEDRVVRTINGIKKRANGNVVVVSHGDPIAALLQYVVERKIGRNKYYVLHPDPGSVSIIEFKDRPELVLFNYHRGLFQR